MNKEIEIPEGYEARIEGNKVILEAKKSKIKIGTQVTAKLYPTKATVIGTFQGYDIEDQEDPTSICGKVFYVKDGVRHLNFVYVDSIKVCDGEDEKVRKALLRCCDDWEKGQFGCMKSEDVPAIRAYLEKHKEQKPAWSEEDEKMLSDCIEAVGSMSVRSDVKTQIPPQPHWKPSEEQMIALNHAFAYYISEGNHSTGDRLKSLYNDLEKL